MKDKDKKWFSTVIHTVNMLDVLAEPSFMVAKGFVEERNVPGEKEMYEKTIEAFQNQLALIIALAARRVSATQNELDDLVGGITAHYAKKKRDMLDAISKPHH